MRSSHGCIRLYPEDIAVFFDLIPIGTKVTVVNQPYLFGWRDGALYLQAYAVMEDDSRNWSKDRKRLLANLLHPKLRGKIAQHDDEIDWQRVGDLAHSPRAVPVPISRGRDGIDAVIAKSALVENTLPRDSNWDGRSGLLVDEKTFNDLLNGRDKAAIRTP
jgi:L,D-transpeptidase ErfK/SrfK